MNELISAWNSHDTDWIGSFFHEDFENHQIPFPPVIGRDAYLRHCEHWFTAYPDFRIEALTLFGSDDVVCLESRASGTRVDQFFDGAPSGRVEVVDALDLLHFSQGKIILERGYWDFSVVTGRIAPQASAAD